mmetsp:Transcript_91478/g.237090  ORF Transcript_91478/g.237090 Transcript_91478/m.237090 type:complete len:436 (+) Transcript_91478:78-1385(+)
MLAFAGTPTLSASAPQSQVSAPSVDVRGQQRFLASGSVEDGARGWGGVAAAGAALAAAGIGAAALQTHAGRTKRHAAAVQKARVVPLSSSVPSAQPAAFVRDSLVACHAQLSEVDAPCVEDADKHIEELEVAAKKLIGGAVAGVVFASSVPGSVEAYPIFAQQNYKEPRDPTGKIACANCHLASKEIDVRLPQEVLPDTIFKATVEIPAKYNKRYQPVADGSKATMNAGAIAIMPQGWKLAPKDRLPKALKKEMKGLAWAPYSKEKPNIVVAGPVPGERYETMTLPILSPDPNTSKDIDFGKELFYFGGNRGRGQVYPEGNQSNNNQFFAKETGTISAVDGLKVSIQKEDGSIFEQEVLPGAQLVVEVGEQVKKDDPITTNPNVGGFGQAEKEVVLQDMNRVYAYCAISFSIFLSQLSFVLKKKQFEKVQLAEGF